jgi:integrase/recombinase XerD
MSGGPYGRGKAPERECMKVECWPDEDQRLRREALTPADPFTEGSGARADHSPRSNVKAEKGYGRFLTFLKFFEPDALNEAPASRIIPQRIRAYVQHMADIGNGSRTILCRLQELGEMAHVFDANHDWSFINAIASRVRAKHQPVRDKSNLRLSDELLELGLELISRAQHEQNIEAAILFRDGLIIAFEALMPIRRRNLADFKMGRNLIAINNKLLVVLDATETKTQATFEVEWPECLIEALEEYLEKYRPILVAQTGRWHKPADDYLWISKDGSPMTQMAIYDRIRLHTKDKFGVAINPHLFRDAAATTMAIAVPGQVRLSAPLLGHRTLSTTEKYYQQATGYEAHKVYVQAISERIKSDV